MTPAGLWDLSPFYSRQVLDLQQHLDGILAPGDQDARQRAGRQLQDLWLLSGLITMTWPLALPLTPGETALAGAFDRHAASQQQEIDERRRLGLRTQALALHDTPPLDAPACAGLLLAAASLLRPSPARADIGTLVAAAFPSTEWHTFFNRVAEFCSPGLRETIEAAMSQVRPPSRRGENSRLLKKPPRPPKPRNRPAVDAWTAYHLRKGHLVIRPQGDCRFDHRHVPQHLPGNWIDTRFSDHPNRYLRRLNAVAAIRLVQMSSGGSHKTAAELLGIPPGTAGCAVHYVRVWTRDPSSSERFTAAVHGFADQLNSSAALTDYARRRAQLAEWVIPADDWEQVSAQIRAAPGLKQTGRDSQRRRTLFSVLAWAAATSGDPRLAPLFLAEPRWGTQLRPDLAQVRYQARAQPTRFAAMFARTASAYGASLGAAIDRTANTQETGAGSPGPAPPGSVLQRT